MREAMGESSRELLDRLHKRLEAEEKERHKKFKEVMTGQQDEDQDFDSDYCLDCCSCPCHFGGYDGEGTCKQPCNECDCEE
ncbi:hypothetical protein LCGC14_0220450 [marine sediment metagenome]|uniref:Uncharacterized protein n=1 Tax=marine sediment metagenome TaxID=412755 RepID=A0A0F9UHP1_9ZZZZ